jgi:hypothetical protein
VAHEKKGSAPQHDAKRRSAVPARERVRRILRERCPVLMQQLKTATRYAEGREPKEALEELDVLASSCRAVIRDARRGGRSAA